ncbi:hypothetical protein CN106_26135 [Sinorhizobium meliloti]|nr:hypothetical protein CN127_27490 [Sinorhizobium meliloti]RVN62030.1 hypothetical protein CN106_26135 [Sinorhizobium meliloti]RVO81104.1 hypothetical protein CN088_27650 [Sinorhizobium meliloti]RVQ09122.1 hypothetical protein CN063_28030 [Sinorhizobium meliloti]
MWVRFLADFDWKPRPPVTIAFKADTTRNVTRACAAAAVAAGKALPTERPADARRQTSLEAKLPKKNRRR